ncbi:hypothetical protein D3C79_274390 [compost metagenome]
MIHLITNIAEWAFVAGIVLLMLYPYLSYYTHHRTLKGILVENGIGYCVALQIAARDRLHELVATLCILFFLAAVSTKVGCVLAIYFFQLLFVIHLAMSAGHKLGTMPSRR